MGVPKSELEKEGVEFQETLRGQEVLTEVFLKLCEGHFHRKLQFPQGVQTLREISGDAVEGFHWHYLNYDSATLVKVKVDGAVWAISKSYGSGEDVADIIALPVDMYTESGRKKSDTQLVEELTRRIKGDESKFWRRSLIISRNDGILAVGVRWADPQNPFGVKILVALPDDTEEIIANLDSSASFRRILPLGREVEVKHPTQFNQAVVEHLTAAITKVLRHTELPT